MEIATTVAQVADASIVDRTAKRSILDFVAKVPKASPNFVPVTEYIET